MSWLYSRALVEEYSAGTCLDGEQSAPLSVMPTPHKFWHKDKMMEFSQLSQFGLTCAVLTENRGEELLTSYLEAFRARILAAQDAVQESLESAADYGKSLPGLLAKYDPDMSSWKTRQCSQKEESTLFSGIWPRWGSMLNGELFRREPPELLTKEKDSGLWPTPTCGGFTSTGAIKKTIKACSTALEAAEITGRPGVVERITQTKIDKEEIRGQMNPDWTEWLMGWPIGWTELKPLAMDKFQSWQQQHSEFYPGK